MKTKQIKKAGLLLAASLLATFSFGMEHTNTAKVGDIKIILYGKGGIISLPSGQQKVCPYFSEKKCADIVVKERMHMNPYGYVWAKVILTNGQVHFVQIKLPQSISRIQ